MKKLVLNLMFVCLLVSVSQAATVNLADYLVNADFEEPIAGSGFQYGDDYLCNLESIAGGWVRDSHYAYYTDSANVDAASGEQFLWIGNTDNASTRVYQLPTCDLVQGNTYEFKLSVRDSSGLSLNYSAAPLTIHFGTDEGILTAKEIITEDITSDWTEIDFSYLYTGNTKAAGTWFLQLYNYGPASAAVSIDNITGVPEPATLSLLGLGALGFIRRKK